MLHDYRYPDAPRYRNVPEAKIVRFLCSPFALAQGRVAEETRAMEALLDHLVVIGLPFRRAAGGERLFDLGEMVNFIKFAHYALGEPVWRERSVATMRRLTLREDAAAEPAEPPDYTGLPTPAYAVTITRRFSPHALRPGAVLRLNMPKPLNAAHGSHRLVWLRTDGAVQEPYDEGSRYCLKVRLDAPSETVVALRHEFTPGQTLTAPDGGETDLRRYLHPTEGLAVVTPQIATLAKRLDLDAADAPRSLKTIWDYVFHELSFGFIQYDRLDPEDPLAWGLEHRRVDCRTGSALIVALCRAANIPARMVSGYTLHPALATSHTWLEAWTEGEGWRPYDTYAIDLAGGDEASPWRQHYFGQIDPRFMAEIPPRHFCGLGSPRLPPRWQLSMGLTDEGATTWFHDVETFAPLYSETVAVQRIHAPR